MVPEGLLPNLESLLATHQWAIPKVGAGTPAREGYPVYHKLADDGGVLIPRYSPIIKELLAHKDLIIKTEPSDIGGNHYEWNPARPMRDKQKPGAAAAEAALRKKRGCLIIGDTGSGKTVVGMRMMYQLQARRTLILVDQLDIARQWAERLREFVPNVVPQFLLPADEARKIMRYVDRKLGPARGKLNETSVTIGTAQSLYASAKYTVRNPFECELLIPDEVHVFGAPTFMGALFKVNYGYSCGLTATDDRKDELDWIFRQCLGTERVEFEGEVMDPVVYRLSAPGCGLQEEEWRMAWCDLNRGMTYLAACRECAFFELFPQACGGNLPTMRSKFKGRPPKVKWTRLNRGALVTALTNDDRYVRWCMGRITEMVQKKRSIFIFGEGRKFLIKMYERALEIWGEANVGLFLGKQKVVGETNYSHQRDSALEKPITFVTYGVARKALDVEQKDCAFFATPVSDGRQAIGRVRRSKKGKVQPIVAVAVPALGTFKRSWVRLETQIRERGWEIKA